MKKASVCLLLFILVGLAAAQTPGQSIAYPDGTRILRHEAVIDAPAAEVWKAFTTKEGVESWMVPAAEMDFRLGGTLKTTYNKEEGVGGPGTIVHRIMAYEPERMIAFHLERAPDSSPDFVRNMAGKTWFVVRLEPLSPQRTRVVETQIGFGDGPGWDQALEKFQEGNDWTMGRLKKRFASAPSNGVLGFALERVFVAFVRPGPKPEKDAPPELHEQHLAWVRERAADPRFLIFGPLEKVSDAQVAGMSVIRAASAQEAERLAGSDPMVQAGFLAIAVVPWHVPQPKLQALEPELGREGSQAGPDAGE